MAIAIDSSLNSSGTSFSFTNTAGNFLVVVACTNSSTPLVVTYGVASMTLKQNQQFTGQSNWLQVFTLSSPATGSNTVAFVGANKVFNATCVSYSGGSTSSQPEVSNATGTNAQTVSNSITTLTNNAWVIAAFGGNSVPTIYTNATARAGNTFPYVADSNGPVSPAGSLTQGADIGSGTTPWAMVQLVIAPSATTPNNSGFFEFF